MQQFITIDLLKQLGVTLPDTDIESLLSHLNETAEERIGLEIAEALSDDELNEMVKLQETASDEVLANWVAEHVPEYKQIVQDNIDIVIGELAESVDHVNES